MKNIHGGDIYQYETILDFSANINPFGTPDSVKKAVKECVDSVQHYPDIACRALRKKIAEAEQVPEEAVICGNGAADLIYRLVMTKKPKRAMVLAPGFAEYEQALKFAGVEVQYYYLDSETFQLNQKFLLELTEELDMLCICSPNNPTGQLIEPELLEAIRITCQEKQIFILMDECFLDFLEEPETHSLLNKAMSDTSIFILKAFTKMYGMAGIRLGYGICKDYRVLDGMYEAGAPWNVSIVAQHAGIAALGDTEFPKRTRSYVKREKLFLYQQLSELGIQYWKTDANFIFFKTMEGLKERMIAEGILIRDCSNYSGLSKGYYRIAVKSHEENERLVQALHNVCHDIDKTQVNEAITKGIGGNAYGKINYDSGNNV